MCSRFLETFLGICLPAGRFPCGRFLAFFLSGGRLAWIFWDCRASARRPMQNVEDFEVSLQE